MEDNCLKDNYDIKVALEETQRSLEKQSEGIKAIKDSTKTIFGASSLLVALNGLSPIFDQRISVSYPILQQVGIALILMLYIALITLCLVVLSPVSMYGPTKPDLDLYKEVFIGKSEREILKQRLVNCLNVIPMNDEIIKKRKRLTNFAGMAFVAIVVTMIIVSVFS